jgi:hypothetical protein
MIAIKIVSWKDAERGARRKARLAAQIELAAPIELVAQLEEQR